MPNDVDEDMIEATIRRVAESKAAQTDGPAIEMPVAESIAPVIEPGAGDDAGGERAAVTARLSALNPAPRPNADDDDGAAPAAPTSLRAQMSGLPVSPMQMQMSAPRPAPMQMPVPKSSPMEMPSRRPPPATPQAISREHAPDTAAGSSEIAAQLHSIAQRLDAVLPLLEQIAASQSSASAGGEWARESDSRAPVSIAPRSAALRDTQPRAGSPERDATIDTRPIPKPLPPLVEPKRGFDLLPRNYRITVEDKRRGVDLVPLHRAMLSMDGVRDMSLLSYNNGVAIVALETTDELLPEVLRESVERAMSRDARVEVHNENTMVVKLSEE